MVIMIGDLQITCNEELEWYKSLKDTQASVTSYGEMSSILKYGTYTIGSDSQSVVTRLHDIITLKLNTTDKRITKKQYSFVELQDLESKLVLITGSKAKNRKEVDLFLDVSTMVCNNYYQVFKVCWINCRASDPLQSSVVCICLNALFKISLPETVCSNKILWYDNTNLTLLLIQ